MPGASPRPRTAHREAFAAGRRPWTVILKRAGGDGAALAAILERITKADDEKPDATSFLRSHPFTAERAGRIRALAGEKPAGPGLLSEAEWRTLQGICPKPVKIDGGKAKPGGGKDKTAPTEEL